MACVNCDGVNTCPHCGSSGSRPIVEVVGPPVLGGSVNRPGSGPKDIEKLPRNYCLKCGMHGASPMVKDDACTNRTACNKRRERALARRQR